MQRSVFETPYEVWDVEATDIRSALRNECKGLGHSKRLSDLNMLGLLSENRHAVVSVLETVEVLQAKTRTCT